MPVMHFGAGTGLISTQIVSFVEKVVAEDTSKSMQNKLVKKPELENKVTIVCQNIIDEGLTENLDLIVSAMAIYLVEDRENYFKDLYSILIPEDWLHWLI